MNNFLVLSKKGLLGGLLLALLLIAACSEREDSGLTRVRGQVVLADSNTPVPRPPQVQVWAQAVKSGGSGLGSSAPYVPVFDPQPTDALGRFDFSFPAASGQRYILHAAAPWPGYVSDWNLAPQLHKGEDNNEVRLPVYAPAWVKVDLVDEPPRSRVWMYLSGNNGVRLTFPRDTTIVFPFLTGGGRETFIYWSIIDTVGHETQERRTFIQPPLDTQRVRIAF